MLAKLMSGCVAAGFALTMLGAMPTIATAAPKAGFLAVKQVGNAVTFKLKIRGFRPDGASVGKANRAGVGHIHFQMDSGAYDYPQYSGPNGVLAAKLGIAGKYSPSATPTITYTNLAKGPHRLVAYLVNNDHSQNGGFALIKFTVK